MMKVKVSINNLEGIDMERKLNENIENAYRMRKESSKAIDTDINKSQIYNKPSGGQFSPNEMMEEPPADYYIDDTPLLESRVDNHEHNEGDLHNLKGRHEQLVDLILKEEDDLIAYHHKFIENTITSGKIL